MYHDLTGVHGVAGGLLHIAEHLDGTSVQIGPHGVARHSVDGQGPARAQSRSDKTLAQAVVDDHRPLRLADGLVQLVVVQILRVDVHKSPPLFSRVLDAQNAQLRVGEPHAPEHHRPSSAT